MNYLVLIGFCMNVAASDSLGLPMSRLTGQFSGLDEPPKRLVDLRLRFFVRRFDGRPIGERRIQSVELDRGRFSVALDLTGLAHHLKSRRVYVEVGLRPAGRRYAGYTPAGPRRVLRIDSTSPYQVWHLDSLPLALAVGRKNPFPAIGKRNIRLPRETTLKQGVRPCPWFSLPLSSGTTWAAAIFSGAAAVCRGASTSCG